MGKQKRKQGRRSGGAGRVTPRASLRQEVPPVAEGVALLAEALLRGEGQLADAFVDLLVGHFAAPEVDGALDEQLAAALTRSWERGWQVADLVHAIGRKLPAPDRRLLVRAVSAAAERWRHVASSDPAWIDQLETIEIDGAGGSASAEGVTAGWRGDERLDRVDALLRAATLLGQLWSMPPLPLIGDPPSRWGRSGTSAPATSSSSRGPTAVDERALGKIRALLAKAESTEYAPEAEALNAKAQELMTRHSIDHALLAAGAGAGRGEEPATRRILIHDPYAKGKTALLGQVARTNRCQSIWYAEAGFCAVVGFPTDLALTDLLFTSLVAQCSTAMQVASREVRQPRSFRESFTIAFALRIGERLEEAAAASVAEAVAERGDDLLPVLASRDAEVEEAFDRAFPHRRSTGYRINDDRGWHAGRAAADVAAIAGGTKAVEG